MLHSNNVNFLITGAADIGDLWTMRTVAFPCPRRKNRHDTSTILDPEVLVRQAPHGEFASVLTLTFENITTAGVEYGSLADGRWQLAIPSLGFTSTEGDTNLRRLFGDINNDGTVSGNPDFAAFGSVFGNTLIGSPFDFNNDGTIDGSTDFAAFGSRFGVTL